VNAHDSPERAPPPPAFRAWTDPWPWPLLCVVLVLASWLFWRFDVSATAAGRPASWQLGVWSLFSATLAPGSWVDLVIGCVSMLVLAVLGMCLGADRATVLAVLLAWPLSAAGLLAWPGVPLQDGSAAISYAMFSALGIHAIGRTATRAAGAVLLVMLAIKLLLDHAWSRPVGYDPNWGTNLVYAAHLCGALAGAVCALLIRQR
jgi:hypothetical protein